MPSTGFFLRILSMPWLQDWRVTMKRELYGEKARWTDSNWCHGRIQKLGFENLAAWIWKRPISLATKRCPAMRLARFSARMVCSVNIMDGSNQGEGDRLPVPDAHSGSLMLEMGTTDEEGLTPTFDKWWYTWWGRTMWRWIAVSLHWV